MKAIGTLYFILLPLVLGAALLEGLWLARTRREGYDWKAWRLRPATSPCADCSNFLPYGLRHPSSFWAYEHRLFTFHMTEVGGVIGLFIGLEFFYYWFHRASHTVRWFWNSAFGPSFAQSAYPGGSVSPGLARQVLGRHDLLHADGAPRLRARRPF